MARFRQTLKLSRRGILAGLLATGGPLACLAPRNAEGAPSSRSRNPLTDVSTWGCQYQNVDLDTVANSGLDMIVIDPCLDDGLGRFVSREDCEAIRRRPDGSRRVVLAYMSVGEVDTKRWYWPEAWRNQAPEWVGPKNPNWPGARSVQYWRAEWQNLLYSDRGAILGRILGAGFDGVFLDRVDGYGDWGGGAAELDAMAALVAAIAAKARKQNPEFIVMIQNAEHVLDRPNLIEAIDGHSKESLLTGLLRPDTPNSPEDVDWSLSRLRPLQRRGIPTFAIEYITEPALRAAIEPQLLELGFKPFFATRGLDRLPAPGTIP